MTGFKLRRFFCVSRNPSALFRMDTASRLRLVRDEGVFEIEQSGIYHEEHEGFPDSNVGRPSGRHVALKGELQTSVLPRLGKYCHGGCSASTWYA
jgi:hypothetical protein